MQFLAQITQLGLLMLIPILVCIFLGMWLDDVLQWSPWLTLGGALLGIVAAFRNLFVWSARMVKIQHETEDPLQPKGEKLR